MGRVCIFQKYKQPLVGLQRGGDSIAWRSRKVMVNGILHEALGNWPHASSELLL